MQIILKFHAKLLILLYLRNVGFIKKKKKKTQKSDVCREGETLVSQTGSGPWGQSHRNRMWVSTSLETIIKCMPEQWSILNITVTVILEAIFLFRYYCFEFIRASFNYFFSPTLYINTRLFHVFDIPMRTVFFPLLSLSPSRLLCHKAHHIFPIQSKASLSTHFLHIAKQ